MDLFYQKIVKLKRQRERNWDRDEKKALIRLAQRYRPIIDNKGNDNIWVRRKNAAWEAIQREMVAEGFRRGVKSVRQQWARAKGEARRSQSQTNINHEKLDLHIDPGAVRQDYPDITQKQETDADPLGCIIKIEECEPEEMRIDADDVCERIITPQPENDPDDQTYEHNELVDSILTSIPSPNFDYAESSGIESTTPSICINESQEQSLRPPKPVETKLLPKKVGSLNILHARLRQIELETAQKAEMHALEVAQKKEIHDLQVQQMREQIEQQWKLFDAQMAKLKSSKYS